MNSASGSWTGGSPSQPPPAVSVVIPCKNALPWLEGLLESVLSQAVDLEVLVVDDRSSDGSVEYVQQVQEQDARVQLLRGEGRGPGAARNLSVKSARGRFLVFADADDLVLSGAYGKMLATLEKTGSDFVVGAYQRHDASGNSVEVKDSIRVHKAEKLGVPGPQAVEGIWEPVLWNKMFRMDFWKKACAPIPETINYEDQPPVVKALTQAESCDFITDLVYSWRIAEEETSRSGFKGSLADAESRLSVSKLLAALLEGESFRCLRSALVQRWVYRDFPMYVDYFSRKEAEDPYLEHLSEWARLIIEVARSCEDPWAFASLRQRLNVCVAALGEPEQVEDLLGVYREAKFNIPLDVQSGSISSLFDIEVESFLREAKGATSVSSMVSLMPQDIVLHAEAFSCKPGKDGFVEVQTYIWLANAPELTLRDFKVSLVSQSSVIPLNFFVSSSPFLKWKIQSKWWDYDYSCFVVEVPTEALGENPHIIRVTLNDEFVENLGFGVSTEVKRSADFINDIDASKLTLFKEQAGLLSLSRAEQKTRRKFSLSTIRSWGSSVYKAVLPRTSALAGSQSCCVIDGIEALGDSRLVGSNDFKFSGVIRQSSYPLPGESKLVFYNSENSVGAPLSVLPDGRFEAVFRAEDLQTNLAYSLQIVSGVGERKSIAVDSGIASGLIFGEYRTLDVRVRENNLVLFVREPKNFALRTRWGQRLIEKQRPVREAVLFESFEGKTAWDNPGAIARFMVENDICNEVPLYMSVAHEGLLEHVPPGIIPVLYGSDTWFEVLSSSKVLVTNNNLPVWFRKAMGQTWVQTWHGSPIKKLLWDAEKTFIGLVYRRLMARQVPEWDLLLAQNKQAAELLCQSMRYEGDVVVGEYPRNFRLVESLGRKSEIKAALGINPESKVLLWAPTWRYVDQELGFPAQELIEDLGYVVLVRGHHMSNLDVPGALDCTEYGFVEDLLAIADVLVTDYSSLAYDYQLTGGDLVFYVPDFEYYSKTDRGLYKVWPFADEVGSVYRNKEDLVAGIVGHKTHHTVPESAGLENLDLLLDGVCDFIEGNFRGKTDA
ncbi:bifunctional glycosyltransferase/CDP-glycerol:glycerophosphate glycerophosphotransferase [Rothia nasimurium]|uniref:bifunctional glycosyltransferase/CDP-glycerol:glycerophosphate glycerophosphotransferase n=1 Tax=Rothia nasimurium TaxID=85336 RepID=UPI003BA20FAD